MIKILGQAVLTAMLVVAGMFVMGLVGDNQSSTDLGATGTRFPNGISADTTSPIPGQVRGTTITTTGAATVGGTLAVTGATTLSSTVTYLEKSTSLTGSTTLTNAQSGTTFYMNTSGGTTTLPAVATATGTVFKFVVASALTATYNAQISSAEGDNIEGSIIVAGAVVDCDANDRVFFDSSGENLGDFFLLRSDGQKWFVTESNALTSAKMSCDG